MEMVMLKGHGECCRLCAARGRLMPVLPVHNGNNMKELIARHLNITILEEDSLPTSVCIDCGDKIVNFHEYFEECSKVQEWFAKHNLKGADTSIDFLPLDDSTVGCSENLKNEIKLEVLELECNFPGIDDQDDTHADSDSSILPLLKISNIQRNNKNKSKRKSKRKEKTVKFENVAQDDFIVSAYIKNDFDDLDYDDEKFDYISAVNADKSKPKSTIKSNSTGNKNYKSNITELIDFHCSVCKKDYLSWYRLKAHSLKMHKSEPMVHCLLCNVSIKSKTAMYKHLADHKSTNNCFTCEVCPKITKSAIAMENHKMRHIPKAERVYKCESCPKIFKSNESLKSHRLHGHVPIEERKKYPCEVCNKSFTTKSAAMGHKRVVHDKIKRYVCDLCGYACATSHELRQHRAIHSEEKLFVCNICSKPFKTDSNLRTHIDTHENTSYQCSVCNKVLNTRRTFRKHLLVHETQRKHVCSFCKVAFKRRQTLKVHLNSHTGDKPIACQWCSERFMYAASYRTHKQRRHPERLMQVAAESAVT